MEEHKKRKEPVSAGQGAGRKRAECPVAGKAAGDLFITNLQPTTYNLQPTTYNLQPETEK